MQKLSRIYFDARWVGKHGIARVAGEMRRRLDWLVDAPTSLPLFHPLDPLSLSLLLRRTKPKVYYTPGFNPPLPTRVPLVLTVHDLNYVYCRENTDFARRLYFETLVRVACRRARFVLTVSEFSRQQLLEWVGVDSAKVVNVGAGVDSIYTDRGAKFTPGFPYLLYVGGRGAHKNIPRMIAAYAAAKISSDVRLLLAGSADPALLEVARRHRVEARVSFIGAIDEADMPALYRGAVALLFPSLYEGFGLPVLEAMACGVPVLTSNVTSLPEVAGGAAVLIDPYSVESIGAGIDRICAETALRQESIERGLTRARSFTWDDSAAKVAAALEIAARG